MKSFQRGRTLTPPGRMVTMPVIVLLTTFSLPLEPTMAQWTQWGGPHQNFKADAKNLASHWPDNGPPRLWQRELGDGYSAILVDHGKLYTMYRNKDGKEVVISMEESTGKTIWEYAYDSQPPKGYVKYFGEGPRSTPLISGDRLYTIGIAGKMHCLNKENGTVYWTHGLWTEFGGNFLPHGYASSPIAYKDTVIVLVGGQEQSIIAFRKSDGSIAWKGLSFENSYSTPRIVKVDGEDQLITFMAEEVIGVDPNNGMLQWRFPHKNRWKQNICMPSLADDNTLFLSSPDAGARGLKLTRHGHKTDVKEVWFTWKIQFYHVTSVDIGDYVYGLTGTHGPFFLSAVNMKTGKIAWRERGFSSANTLYADGKFIILDEDGNLTLATATPEDFTVLSKFQLFKDVSWTVPTVAGQRLYVRDKKTIQALDLG